MFRHKADAAVVLGAGFSRCGGLPMTTELSNDLLSTDFQTEIDVAITNAIGDFLSKAFYWKSGEPLPSLEDIFTMIDLSTNSGHNLGKRFNPRMLRALRRMLIYRVFTILDRKFVYSVDIARLIEHSLGKEKQPTTHFVVLNWDIVLEGHLNHHSDLGVDYCVQAVPWDGNELEYERVVAVAKVHGASNWVYCDNCRTLYYDRYSKLSLAVRAGLVKADFRLFDESFGDTRFDAAVGMPPSERNCRKCQVAVGPHIATFSFRKSFRTHAFASSWLAAEQILSQANRWLYIGYSLPEADYEFKHLLKTAQLKFAKGAHPQKEIEVVLFNDTIAEQRYRRFFGATTIKVHQDGLSGFVQAL